MGVAVRRRGCTSNWASNGASRERRPGSTVHYAGCNEVRALGKAPLTAGQPGYRTEMDGDGDGIAREPHPGV